MPSGGRQSGGRRAASGEPQDVWIYPAGERQPPRVLTADDDVVTPFAAINAVSIGERPRALLAFIKSFGLLGQTVLAGQPRRRRGRLYMADNVVWALQHARNVGRILRLYRSRFEILDALLDSLNIRTVKIRGKGQVVDVDGRPDLEPGPAQSVSHQMTLRIPVLTEPWIIGIRLDTIAAALLDAERDEHGKSLSDSARRRMVPALLRERPLDVGRQVIAASLNPNLMGVSRADDPAADLPVFTFPTLIQLVYWQLADRLGRYDIRQCRCGALFFADDQREGWHSRQCFRRFYMRDYRKGKLRRAKEGKTK